MSLERLSNMFTAIQPGLQQATNIVASDRARRLEGLRAERMEALRAKNNMALQDKRLTAAEKRNQDLIDAGDRRAKTAAEARAAEFRMTLGREDKRWERQDLQRLQQTEAAIVGDYDDKIWDRTQVIDEFLSDSGGMLSDEQKQRIAELEDEREQLKRQRADSLQQLYERLADRGDEKYANMSLEQIMRHAGKSPDQIKRELHAADVTAGKVKADGAQMSPADPQAEANMSSADVFTPAGQDPDVENIFGSPRSTPDPAADDPLPGAAATQASAPEADPVADPAAASGNGRKRLAPSPTQKRRENLFDDLGRARDNVEFLFSAAVQKREQQHAASGVQYALKVVDSLLKRGEPVHSDVIKGLESTIADNGIDAVVKELKTQGGPYVLTQLQAYDLPPLVDAAVSRALGQ